MLKQIDEISDLKSMLDNQQVEMKELKAEVAELRKSNAKLKEQNQEMNKKFDDVKEKLMGYEKLGNKD